MYLLLSIAEDWLSSVDPASPAAQAIIRAIVEPQAATTEISQHFVAVSKAIWEAGEQWARNLFTNVDWSAQSLLALIAGAIRYVSRPLPHALRSWYFDLACVAAQQLLWRFGSYAAPRVREATREAADRPVGAVRVRDARARELGVHLAIEAESQVRDQPMYVPRDFDALLREALARGAEQGCFLVLVGPAASGKTRALYEAVRATVPDWWLVHPDSSDEIRALAESPTSRTVIWLDELAHYLNDGLTASTVRTLVAAGGVLLGTLWAEHHAALASTGQESDSSTARGREVLSLARMMEVPAGFTAAERDRARQLAVTDPRIRTALLMEDCGPTQALAAGPSLVRRWQNAYPYARAVITVAVDARRLGLESSLTRGLLEEAVPGYLTPAEWASASPRWLDDALAYATTPLYGAIAPLAAVTRPPVGHSGYLVADYLSQYAQRVQGTAAVPPAMWSALANHVTDLDDTLRIADNARARMRYTYAEALYRRVSQSGDGRAGIRLAELLAEQNRVDEAVAVLRPFADLRDVRAGLQLADLLAGQARDDEAAEVLKPLVNRADADAIGALARLLARQGRVGEAEYHLRRAADAGDASASRQLADLLAQQGRVDEATVVLYSMVDRGDEGAASQLAELLDMEGRSDEAIDFLRRIADGGDVRASMQLVDLLAQHDRTDDLRARADVGDEHAARRLADLVAQQGRVGEPRVVVGTPQWDLGVITILAVEARAVIDVLARSGRYQRNDQSGQPFHEADVPIGGQTLKVVATRALDLGQRSTILAFEKLRRRYRPRIIALVGIAAGIHPDIQLGDVVIAREVVYYDGRTKTPTGVERRGRSQPLPAAVLHAVKNFFDDHGEPYRLVVTDRDTYRSFLVRSGMICSGEAIIAGADSEILSYLARFNDHTLAVEMESGGFTQAFYEGVGESSVDGWLVVRGISDLTDHSRDDRYQEIAARNAAATLQRLFPYLGKRD